MLLLLLLLLLVVVVVVVVVITIIIIVLLTAAYTATTPTPNPPSKLLFLLFTELDVIWDQFMTADGDNVFKAIPNDDTSSNMFGQSHLLTRYQQLIIEEYGSCILVTLNHHLNINNNNDDN